MEYLVVGLGNPGEEYRLTRHNAGFLVVDQLAKSNRLRLALLKPSETALGGWFRLGEHRVMLAKPTTFMNRSGVAVKTLMERYSFPLSRVIIISDDFSLPFGFLRLRARGSSGGHKGLSSIISYTGAEFARLKIGIGRPAAGVQAPDFVLNRFTAEEEKFLSELISVAGQAVVTWIQEGTEKAMSLYNGMIQDLKERPERI